MSNFLIVLPSDSGSSWGRQIFETGLRLETVLRSHKPSSTVETDLACVASFPRLNGSGTPVVTAPETGNWLVALGTWFHRSGFGPGNEEQLLQRLNKAGAEGLAQELEGFFVVAGGNVATREVTVITDIVGSRHCFSRSWREGIVLSGSSMLLAALEHSRLDSVACQEFMTTGVIYEDRTLYREVRKLAPATCFQYRNGALTSSRRYWRISDLEPDSLDGAEAVGTLQTKLVEAAHRVTSVFKQPVCDLTGGYDSRALVAALVSARVEFSTAVSGDPNSPDVLVSSALAKRLGLTHRHFNPDPVSTLDEIEPALQVTDGEYDSIEYARVRRIHSQLALCGDISLNGSFGEVGRGYWWELLFPDAGKRQALDANKLARLRYAAERFDASILPGGSGLQLVSHFQAMIERTNEGLTHLPNTMQMDNVYLNMRMHRWQGKIASSTDQVWPCLSPFLMRSVLETMLRTRSGLRRRGLLIRKLLGGGNAVLANYPLEHGYPPLPVSLKTFYRFWPVVPQYGRKVIKRIQRYAGRNQAGAPNPRAIRLWQDPAVLAIWQDGVMRTGEVFEPNALKRFIEHSNDDGFQFSSQLRRLLTLECGLRRLSDARLQLSPPDTAGVVGNTGVFRHS